MEKATEMPLKEKKIKEGFNKSQSTKILIVSVAAAFLLFVAFFLLWTQSFTHTDKVRVLEAEEKIALESKLSELFPKRNAILTSLPYELPAGFSAFSDIGAESAILVDVSNGAILYEKNADELIPPASMTKLFVMYIVYKEVENGKVTLDDVVKLPENSWWINLPRDSSLMFLGQGQIVTLRELLLGLAIASGNDAAIAVAYYISGGVPQFVERMNEEARALGLEKTHFVEPSGYSEENLTTAREFAAFAKTYISKYPESLVDYHSKANILYPLEKNLPPWEKEKGDTSAIFQKNTNPLLGVLEGCDGLKTGFIYESGYNLALTAIRGNVRFLSVTMKGPGVGSKQGNEWRVRDGMSLFDWAFENFSDYKTELKSAKSFPVAVYGAREKFLNLIPAWERDLTVLKAEGMTAVESALNVRCDYQMQKKLFGAVQKGGQFGKIVYSLNGEVLEEVPLVADRDIEEGNIVSRIFGTLAMKVTR